MPESDCMLIHAWPIIHIGLRSVLQSLKLEIGEPLTECPECKTLTNWSDAILLVDVKHEGYVRKHLKFFRKRNISVVGLNFSDQTLLDATVFDELLLQTDSQLQLFSKLSRLVIPKNKTRTNHRLSTREIDVLKLVALGQSNRQIAENLFISIHTVITHRKHITAKLGIKSISGLTLYAAVNHLIDQS